MSWHPCILTWLGVLLLLSAAVPRSVAAADRASYLFVARLQEAGQESWSRRIVPLQEIVSPSPFPLPSRERVAETPQQAAGNHRIDWNDLANRPFWLLRADAGGAPAAEVPALVTGKDLPPALVTVAVAGARDGAHTSRRCSVRLLTIAGRMAEASPEVRDLAITGTGTALLCKGETAPRATAMRLVRRVQPPLWKAAPDVEIISELDMAWAALP